MTPDQPEEPDWVISLDSAPEPLSEEAEVSIARARVVVAGFIQSVRVAQACARDAESRLRDAHAAGVSASLVAGQVGLSLEAVEQVMRGESRLLPELG